MGADFVYAYTPIREDRETWISRLAKTSDTDIADIFDATGFDHLLMDDEDGRTILLNVINEIWDAHEHHNRETATLVIDGELCLLTGGTTWGDPPTDIYDSIMLYEDFQSFYICTSDDPNNHQGDTCPIHEGN